MNIWDKNIPGRGIADPKIPETKRNVVCVWNRIYVREDKTHFDKW